jgi:hypothetical protein
MIESAGTHTSLIAESEVVRQQRHDTQAHRSPSSGAT